MEGSNSYRAPQLGNKTQTTEFPAINVQVERCIWEVVDFNSRNGVTLEDVIKFYNPDCNIKSDFLNIDPDGTAPNNSFYQYAQMWLQDLVIFQSSDIIRSAAGQAAFNAGTDGIDAGDLTFSSLWHDLKKMFNLRMIYDPVADCIRFEHVSYIQNRPILDLFAYANGKYLNQISEITYDSLEFPTKETWEHAFKTLDKDFDGAFIEYDSNCTNGETKECKLESIVTNVGGLYNNAEITDDSKLQSITLISTTDGLINSCPGAFSDRQVLNGPLAFPKLIENLHTIGRPFSSGIMNFNETQFIKPQKHKKFTMSLRVCCDQYYSGRFNSEMLVKTKLGMAEIVRATYYDPSEKLVLEVVA